MQIPWHQLSTEALTGLIEEYVTREGTEYGRTDISLQHKVDQVRTQLRAGEAVILYDPDVQTCHIVTARDVAPDESS